MDPLSFVNFLTWSFWFLLAADFVLLVILLGIEVRNWWKGRNDD